MKHSESRDRNMISTAWLIYGHNLKCAAFVYVSIGRNTTNHDWGFEPSNIKDRRWNAEQPSPALDP